MRLFQAPLDTCLGSPFFASLSVHGLHPTFFHADFREGISSPNFVEGSILPLSKLCAEPFALQSRALFEGEKKGEKAPRKGEEEGWPAKGAKRKKDA